MMNIYLNTFNKYFDFSGRATRKECCVFLTTNLLIISGLIFLALILEDDYTMAIGFMLITFIPSAAVGVRRLHDINYRGYWILLTAIPLVNLVVLYFLSLKGRHINNIYGSPPE